MVAGSRNTGLSRAQPPGVSRRLAGVPGGLAALVVLAGAAGIAGAAEGEQPMSGERLDSWIADHCRTCHNGDSARGGLDLDALRDDLEESGSDEVPLPGVPRHAPAWERVLRKLVRRQMPPQGRPRPDETQLREVTAALERALDHAAALRPDPGPTESLRRLTRAEYQNAIRDLLALEIDATSLLPADEPAHGFDTGTAPVLSPTLLDRYLGAAQKISRLAVGAGGMAPTAETYRVRPDLTQEDRIEGLPPGTRGGTLILHHFPAVGEYEIQVRLARDRNEEVEGLKEAHELEILLDRRRIALFTVAPPADGRSHEAVDRHLTLRFPSEAGRHELGVTFLKKPSRLVETRRQPYNAHFNMHRHPRLSPAVYQVSVTGPHGPSRAGDTPSRRRIFGVQPAAPLEAVDRARAVLTPLARRALRRPITEEDLRKPLELFREGLTGAAGGKATPEEAFEAGVELALAGVLVSPSFLFRVEAAPAPDSSGAAGAERRARRVTDLELASRLSFFLWSSLPDDQLLDLAAAGGLGEPRALEREARRLLADPRARSLVTRFGSQWLHLGALESITPDLRLFPDFDDNLRQAFRRETELLLESVFFEDRSVLELLHADFTYLNERLARHYGLPHIVGPRFRRVPLEAGSDRGGLLRQGSLLTLTSYATRTSPVVRGRWILENLLGAPPPPPPPDVPALRDVTVRSSLSVRDRLAEHRSNAACAGCHRPIDPLGLAMEGYDAVGRRRTREDDRPVDETGALPDGTPVSGVPGLEGAILERPEILVSTLVEKLLTFALGRGVTSSDAPAVRAIVRGAKSEGYRFSSIVLGVVESVPFQWKRLPVDPVAEGGKTP